MSLAAFQTQLARLISDPAAAADPNFTALPDLSAHERSRLLAIARSPGLAITQKLHRGFRVGKLLSLLPLSCALLGETALADLAQLFWRACPSRSFHFWEEATEFAEFVLAQDEPVRHLAEVVSYERASLRLRCEAEAPGARIVLLWPVDPRPVLLALSRGETVPPLPQDPHALVGQFSAESGLRWELARSAMAVMTIGSETATGTPA
jgi:hypothetical protein